MTKRLIPFILILLFGLTTAAMADGGFYGYVTFKYCDCNAQYVWVSIYHIETQQSFTCIIRCGGRPGYSTNSNWPNNTYPPGHYQITVAADPNNTDCVGSPTIQTITHGSDWQEVDLDCWGPVPEPNRPQGP